MNIFINKKTLTIFGILIVTFIFLLLLRYTAIYAIEENEKPSLEKLQILLGDWKESGITDCNALEMVIAENSKFIIESGLENNRVKVIVTSISFALALFLLYLASVLIHYITRAKQT